MLSNVGYLRVPKRKTLVEGEDNTGASKSRWYRITASQEQKRTVIKPKPAQEENKRKSSKEIIAKTNN